MSRSEVIPMLARLSPITEVSINMPVTTYDNPKPIIKAAIMANMKVITANIFPRINASDLTLTIRDSTSLDDFSSTIDLTI